MMDDEMNTHRPSIISSYIDGTLISNSGSLNLTAKECEKQQSDALRDQIRSLEGEILGLRRLMDMQGHGSINDDLLKLSTKLAQTEEQLEEANNMCAEQHKQHECATQNFFEQLNALEQLNRDTTERAQVLEEENQKLRQEVENDNSKIYHLMNQQSGEELYPISQTVETVAALKQELDDRLSEIDELKRQTNNWRFKFDDLQAKMDQQQRNFDAMRFYQDARKLILEKSLIQRDVGNDSQSGTSYSDTEYIVANMFALLDLLDSNGREVNILRQKVVELLKQHGYVANEANVTALSQTFVDEFSKQREVIKARNYHLTDVIGTDTILQQHLDKLDDTSMTNNSMAAPGMTTFNDFVRNASAIDILNRTKGMSQDMGAAHARMNALSAVCSQLFEKLRGTAEFLEHVLETLDETEEGREILRKIQELRLDLDKSMQEARFATTEFEKVHKSLREYCDFMDDALDRTADDNADAPEDAAAQSFVLDDSSASFHGRSSVAAKPAGDCEPAAVEELKKELVSVKESNESLKNSLRNELQIKETLSRRIAELEVLETQYRAELERVEELLSSEQKTAEKYQQLATKYEADLKTQNVDITQLQDQQKNANELLEESKQRIERLSQELARYQTDYEALTSDQQTLVDNLSAKEDLVDQLQQKLDELRQVNLEHDKTNEELQQKNRDLKQEYNALAESYQKSSNTLERANAILYEKIDQGMKDLEMNAEESAREDDVRQYGADNGDAAILDNKQFTNFLADCQQRANKVVQLLKKAEEAMAETKLGVEIPYLTHMLLESRSIRLMLHKITRFFESQKENCNATKRISSNEICAELERIYVTMTSAKEAAGMPLATRRNGAGASGTGTGGARDPNAASK